ncbi:DJ-1 family glyoxalase III [Ghiorsea bivora]|uniref:DJ-1 family glyoxalase III n=1 Tax=Ghiorsea bivora TaxID=1485545 RepID=UPI00056E07F8|nr:DJ-1 family glyoxalase III [Ghiorsea bivora]
MKRVLIPFTTGVEEIELVAIVDILRRADVEVCMASLDGKPVVGRSGITLHADQHIQDCVNKAWDMIVLPGGLPNAQLLQDSNIIKDMMCKQAAQQKIIAAICAAPVALAHFGLTANKQVTSYPSFEAEMQQQQPSSKYKQQAVVKDEHIITSRGAGTAIEFALALVAQLCGQQQSQDIRVSIVA